MKKNLCLIVSALCIGLLGSCALNNTKNKTDDTKKEETETTETEAQTLIVKKYTSDYYVGDTLNYDQTEVFLYKGDGSFEVATKDCTFAPEPGYCLSTAGVNKVQITHTPSGLTAEYNINVLENVYVTTTLKSYKQNYMVGARFYYSDVEIVASTALGKEVNITPLCTFNVQDGEILSTSGTKNIKANFGSLGKICDFYIEIDDLASVEAIPNKYTYILGEKFDYSKDFTIQGYTTSGNTIDITKDCTISIPDGYVFNEIDEDISVDVYYLGTTYCVSYLIDVVSELAYKIFWRKNISNPLPGYSSQNISACELACQVNYVYFGKTKDYETKIKNLDPVHIGESYKDKVYLYYKEENSSKYVYILSEGKIVFEEDDHPTNQGFFAYFNAKELVLNNIDFSNVISFYQMFVGCNYITSLDLRNISTTNVISFINCFNGCRNLKNLLLPNNFITSTATDLSCMFYECKSLEDINLSGNDFSNVTNLNGMFGSCDKLETVNLSGLDCRNVAGMTSMFSSCSDLRSVNFTNFKTEKLTNMSNMFSNCTYLEHIDLCSFDTRMVNYMNNVFEKCVNLTSVNVCNFDTEKVYTFKSMFSDCSKLASIDIRTFSAQNCSNMESMFCNDYNLKSITLKTSFKNKSCTKTYMFYGLPSDAVYNCVD